MNSQLRVRTGAIFPVASVLLIFSSAQCLGGGVHAFEWPRTPRVRAFNISTFKAPVKPMSTSRNNVSMCIGGLRGGFSDKDRTYRQANHPMPFSCGNTSIFPKLDGRKVGHSDRSSSKRRVVSSEELVAEAAGTADFSIDATRPYKNAHFPRDSVSFVSPYTRATGKLKSHLSPPSQRQRTSLSSSISYGPVERDAPNVLSRLMPAVERLDLALFLTYICGIIAITMPTVLLPVIAADPATHAAAASIVTSAQPSAKDAAAFVAKIASLSTLGGAMGKFLNGFVCQAIGGRSAARIYLLGLSFFSFLLSFTSSMHGPMLAGMEFCASVMWTACTVMLANAYENSPEKFGRGIMIVSLASTTGTLLTKMVGTALLRTMHWRQVAKLGACVALLGSGVVHMLVREKDCLSQGARRRKTTHVRRVAKAGKSAAESRGEKVSFEGIASSLMHVVGNRLFWVVGVAHAMAFLARSSDRILGSFFHQATNLPSYICGGMTSSVTVGFAHGLFMGKKFHSLESQSEKRRFLKRRYVSAVVSALGLALCATGKFSAMLSKHALAAAVAVASAAMASSMSFQFYQLPAQFATSFGKNKAICVSFLDGMGFFLGAPIFAAMSRIISSHGWSMGWTMIAGFLTFGGALMMSVIPAVMQWDDEESGSNE